MSTVPLYRQDARHPQAQACAACEIRSTALFGVLDADGLDRIHLHIETLELASDSVVYDRGSSGAAVYTVRTGVVRCERVNSRGERRIMRLAGRGDLIGQEALLQRPYGHEAIVCMPTQLCRIPRALIDGLAEKSGALPRELMLRWQRALDASESWMSEVCTGPARLRVLRMLQRLQDHAQPDGTLWLPRREEMSAMLDMTVETASRLISQLRREGVLERLPVRLARVNASALHRALTCAAAGS